jgi:hypothetical protein
VSVEAAWLPEPEEPAEAQPVPPVRPRPAPPQTATDTARGASTQVTALPVPRTALSDRRRTRAREVGTSPVRSGAVGVLVGLAALAVGFAAFVVPAVVVWVLAGPALSGLAFTDLVRVCVLAMVAAVGTPVTIGAVQISLLPLGWAVVPLAAVWIATRSVRRLVGHRPAFLGALTVTSAFLGACAALLASTDAAHVGPVRATATTAALALAAGLLALRVPQDWLRRAPAEFARGVRGGLLACAVLVLAGLGGVVVSSVIQRAALVDLVTAGATGPAGLPAMIALLVGYLPVAVVWSTSYLLGVGFDLGVLVAPWTADVYDGPVPGIGWVAIVPVGGASGLAALAITWGGCAVLGALLVRGAGHGRAVALRAAGAVSTCVIGMAALGWAASGGFGSGSLAGTGPAPLLLAAAAALPLGAGILFGLGVRQLAHRRMNPSAPTARVDGDDDEL